MPGNGHEFLGLARLLLRQAAIEIGRPGGMRAHTPLRATDFEAVVSTDSNHGTMVPGVGIAPTKSRGLGAVAVLIRALTPAGQKMVATKGFAPS